MIIGRWVVVPDEQYRDIYRCSECGHEPLTDGHNWFLTDYCPLCGACMKGECYEAYDRT